MSPLSRPLPSVTGPGRRARWRRGVLRRVLSGLLAGTALAVVVTALRPPPPTATQVLVAARPVAAGAVLATADLRSAPLRADAVPPGAVVDLTVAVGRRVGAALATGEALTTTRLVPRGAADGLPRGRVAVHVVAADPASVDLLSPGDAARVYPAAGGSPLAVAARVLSTDPASGPADPLAPASSAARGVVLSLTAGEADAVLGGHGSVEGPVTVTVVAAPG